MMIEDALTKLAEAGSDYSVEARIGLVILRAAAADGEISDVEYVQMGDILNHTLEEIGVTGIDSNAVLHSGFADVYNQELLLESIDLLGAYLPKEVLSELWEQILVMSGADGLDDEEEDFMSALGKAWDLG